MNIPFRLFTALTGIMLFCCARGAAQDLQSQPVPFTAYLDFKAIATSSGSNAALPIWLESVEFDSPKTDGTAVPEKSTFRLRFRKLAGINDELLLRLFFDDTKGKSPEVSAWTELGERMMIPKTLGSGLGLPASESVLLPMTGVDYIEIEVPGDGSSVRSAFLSSIQKAQILKAIDFELPATLADPFQAAPAVQHAANDAYLYGRVKATLDSSTVRLSSTDGTSSAIQFELATRPLIAVITFEILNADLNAPPQVFMNDHPLGAASLQLPDLADPAFLGTVRPLENDMQFHYAGWIKCQKIVPGSALQVGANQLVLQLGDAAGTVAIRSVEVQLKYNWENLEYNLQP
jgi:hypothetical protein